MTAHDDATVRIADPWEHAALRPRYLAWGYDGGIGDDDVVFVAERAGEPVGIVRRTVEHGVTMLRGMQVEPAHRRHGVGARLLAAFVRSLGDAECWCIPFAHLTGFYGAAGFRAMDEGDAPPFLRDRLAGYRARGLAVLAMRRERGPRSDAR